MKEDTLRGKCSVLVIRIARPENDNHENCYFSYLLISSNTKKV